MSGIIILNFWTNWDEIQITGPNKPRRTGDDTWQVSIKRAGRGCFARHHLLVIIEILKKNIIQFPVQLMAGAVCCCYSLEGKCKYGVGVWLEVVITVVMCCGRLLWSVQRPTWTAKNRSHAERPPVTAAGQDSIDRWRCWRLVPPARRTIWSE